MAKKKLILPKETEEATDEYKIILSGKPKKEVKTKAALTCKILILPAQGDN